MHLLEGRLTNNNILSTNQSKEGKMRNHLNWLFLFLLGLAFLGCQDDIGVNDPINSKTKLNRLSALESGKIGNRVWNDIDKDGIQDMNEPGIPDIGVGLFDCHENWISIPDNPRSTDANGNYLFENLPAGQYLVKIHPWTAGIWTLTTYDAGNNANDEADSDIDPADSLTICIDLVAGEEDLSWDAGFYQASLPLGKIGNRVWNDHNKNGIQDFGELGIKNVKVELYDCTEKLVHTTYTNYFGYYYFRNLIPGNYKIKFYASAEYGFTKKDQGTSDKRDSDADPVTGSTECLTLGNGETNLNIDAGLYLKEKIRPRSYGYWKTHSKYGPSSYDPTWALIGEDTDFFQSGQSWYKVIKTEPRKGNVYYILAHQYIAARLNELAGVNVPENVADAMAKAFRLFSNYKPADLEKLWGNNELRKEFLMLSWYLEKYNNGNTHWRNDDDDD
jgi:hypothetical protein